jgi:predicted DNA-binding transcriptional regulator YafY
MSPLERLMKLLTLLLETRVPLTQKQLVEAMSEGGEAYGPAGSSLRTKFERDKAALRNMGVPIRTTVLAGDQAGETGYWVERSEFEMRGLELDDDETRALQIALALNASDHGQRGLWKLGGGVAVPSTVRADVPVLDELVDLRTAIRDRASVTFDYRGTRRTLDPYGMLLRRGWWYLIGLDHDHREQRTYRIDRIDGDVTVGAPGSFERPPDFDANAAVPADARQIGGGPERIASVRVADTVLPLVLADLGDSGGAEGAGGAGTRRDPDAWGTVVSVPFTNLDALRSWVLGFGVDAEVLGPDDVRAAIIAWLREIAASDPGEPAGGRR